jgi:uncharacterized Zn finger protein
VRRGQAWATTWWGRRWLDGLERIFDPARLGQGRWHAQAGRVVRLDVRPGLVTARLEGGQAVPRQVHFFLATLSGEAWQRALATLAGQAEYTARLLAGDVPEDVEAAFAPAGVSLFPRLQPVERVSGWGAPARPRDAPLDAGELRLACTCSEGRKQPCKHQAAVGYALARRLDADPFLLFTLRGRTREAVLSALRAYRADGAGDAALDAIADLAARVARETP